jgi:hypothetical protein
MRIRYDGDGLGKTVLGHHFPSGETVEVNDSVIARQALSCAGFREVKRGRPKKVDHGKDESKRDRARPENDWGYPDAPVARG